MYLVTLPNRPYHPVTITFATLTPAITSSPLSLTILPELWDSPHELTVIAREDEINSPSPYGSGFRLVLESEDSNYNGTELPEFLVSVEDNDEGKFSAWQPGTVDA